jgi:hypothetical protein
LLELEGGDTGNKASLEAVEETPKRRYKKITQADLIGKTSGRWTRGEHLKFIQGTFKSLHISFTALKLFGKDWKKVEDFIGTRTGAQIRSHA